MIKAQYVFMYFGFMIIYKYISYKEKNDRVDFSDVEIDVFFGISDVNGDGAISTDVSSLKMFLRTNSGEQ